MSLFSRFNINKSMFCSVYSCVFFSLTGLHFFHLVVGLLLLGLSSRSCSFLQEVLCQLLIFGNRKRRIENICILGNLNNYLFNISIILVFISLIKEFSSCFIIFNIKAKVCYLDGMCLLDR